MKNKILSRASLFALLTAIFLLADFFAYAIDKSSAATGKTVILGDQRHKEYLPLLKGKRVALFSNATGIVGDVVDGKPSRMLPTDATVDLPLLKPGSQRLGRHILDFLLAKRVNVTEVFSPEHGFRGDADAGQKVSGYTDEKTGVRVVSLYGVSGPVPKPEDVAKFDALVVDIQDVGLRYYTYYVTMLKLMNACAENGKKVIILDRPNPNGFYVDGPILDTLRFRSGVGALPIPIVHGMTLGELALMSNGEGWLPSGKTCDLTVIPCENYTRDTKYSLIVQPSPNLKTMRAVYLYASTCFFEGTNVSLGRGTEHPFEIYGHPALNLPDDGGARFSFTPRSMPGAANPPCKDQLCYGRDLRKKPIADIWDEEINLEYFLEAHRNLGPEAFFFLKGNRFFELLVGVPWVRPMIAAGYDADTIKSRWAADIESFERQRAKYLIY